MQTTIERYKLAVQTQSVFDITFTYPEDIQRKFNDCGNLFYLTVWFDDKNFLQLLKLYNGFELAFYYGSNEKHSAGKKDLTMDVPFVISQIFDNHISSSMLRDLIVPWMIGVLLAEMEKTQ